MNVVSAPFKSMILNPDISTLKGCPCQALELTSVVQHRRYTMTMMCLTVEPSVNY